MAERTSNVRKKQKKSWIFAIGLALLVMAMPSVLYADTGYLPDYAFMETENILQEPELPTGCESVSLAMALNALGYHVGKTEIADYYLSYGSRMDEIAYAFVGDPYSYSGPGIYPPGLAAAANSYLWSHSAWCDAYDMTGTAFQDLLTYVASGCPVLCWITADYEHPRMSGYYSEYYGSTYRWYWNEHCAMLAGYDLGSGLVALHDPIYGEIWLNMEAVEGIYDAAGRMAVVIM